MHTQYITTYIKNQPKGYLADLAHLAGKDLCYFSGVWQRVKKGLANDHDKEMICGAINKTETQEITINDFLWN